MSKCLASVWNKNFNNLVSIQFLVCIFAWYFKQMIMIHSTIQAFMPQVIKLLKKHKIKNAYIFGSAVTEWFNEKSDVDFLVTLQEGLDPVDAGGHLWDLEYELKDLLHHDIDLLTERSLKNPYFITEINATKQPIYV